MTENQIIKAASTVGAHCNDEGRWNFEDDEHLVEFALEIIHLDRERRLAGFKHKMLEFLDDNF